ncbi:efflux RND transporter periplasmic adaptor subunit [Amylibacter sp.]|jgi:multidrug efflux system membrane fusion protein|nr:efflux RND transporter periplasmic adaptor subunit [Amylibacter sp.]MDA9304494.1 efflux RND transporter periplasmic adaptor subunit [Amylibacter sp.]MDA9370382.1 efflux RND transporter periplasmic adaptor subunit [Amylibacter sp.]MDA9780455.1 efflux RND transporter periplasmic adaptor subunit [Amylibacter sp.]MDB4017694.1 efflux RND transporter periplasmic adaptor subunit [Amylibacter sp.]|tara:strand:- start:332 stop:1519 length:1188 start_codon:yes stop_codon:yes gene_type:complete
MRISSIIIAIIVCAGIAGFIFRNDLNAYLNTQDVIIEETNEISPEIKEKKINKQKAVSVLVQKSNEQEVTNGILLRGQTEAFKSVQVKAETSGSVISQPIRKGTFVKNGELLCELEVGTKSDVLSEAKVALALSLDELDASIHQYELRVQAAERQKSLLKRGVGTEAAVEAAELSASSAETQSLSKRQAVANVEARINRATTELNNTKIIAPFDGLLESDTAEYGDFMQTGAPCGTLLALNPIKLIGYATETQVSKIEVNTTAGARLISGDTVSGTVSFISRSADPTTRTFLVETTVPNENYEIREGSTADIYISLAGAKGHLLPQSSLTLNSSGVLGVRIALDDKAKFIPINIIRDAEEGVWVTGLPNSVDVIIVGQEYVTDNSNIKVSYKVSQ